MAIPEPLGKPFVIFITRSARLAVAVVCRVRRVWRQKLNLALILELHRKVWKGLPKASDSLVLCTF